MRGYRGIRRVLGGLLGVACLLSGGTARAALVTSTYTLPEFNSLVTAGVIKEYAVAESRIGNAALNGTFEVDLGKDTAAPSTQAQYAWSSGTPVDFRLSYDPATFTLRYLVGNTVDLSYVVPAADRLFNDLFIRTFANAANNGSSASIVVDELVLDGTPVLAISSASAPPQGGEVLRITGGMLLDGFTLTGKQTFSWSGNRPNNSNLATQIKLGTVVPEPSSVALLGMGLAGAAGYASRRRLQRRRIGDGATNG